MIKTQLESGDMEKKNKPTKPKHKSIQLKKRISGRSVREMDFISLPYDAEEIPETEVDRIALEMMQGN